MAEHRGEVQQLELRLIEDVRSRRRNVFIQLNYLLNVLII